MHQWCGADRAVIKFTMPSVQTLATSKIWVKLTCCKALCRWACIHSQYGSDLWLEDGSFIRWENLNLGYRIPVNNSKYISSVRFSVTGNNLLLITKYTGTDPELSTDGNNTTGIDNGIYPRTRTVALGLNVVFK
jgi:hypothetical protein